MNRVGVERFEEIYAASRDPWNYLESRYELEKYQRTMSAIPPHIEVGLELGCSIGVFTAMLAPRCLQLIGIDFSATAVAEARRRTESLPNVRIFRRDLPREMPAGSFDLIVCSELLYYWREEDVLECLSQIEARLNRGGRLVVVGWKGEDPETPLDAGSVRALLEAESSLEHVLSQDHPGYLLDAWDRG
jgi:SAM-dependent methyltransferase